MTKAVITSFHNYAPMYDHKYFDVISDYYFHNFNNYWADEVDKLYILDSNWNIKLPNSINKERIRIIQSDPNDRYYDAYKKIIPKIQEKLVFFIDNDTVIYEKGVVESVFRRLNDDYETYASPKYEVVSIYDTIGKKNFRQLNGKSKFCPYWFATQKDILMDYFDVNWGPNMPDHETFGKLTEEMLFDDVKVFEQEEDKTSLYFDGNTGYGKKGKSLGYYHIRAGSTPAYLLTHRNFGNKKTYEDYIKNQPRQEYLRQLAWYWIMITTIDVHYHQLFNDILALLKDISITEANWLDYIKKFVSFHNL